MRKNFISVLRSSGGQSLLGLTAVAAIAIVVRNYVLELTPPDEPEEFYIPVPTADERLPAFVPMVSGASLEPLSAADYPAFLGADTSASTTAIALAADWQARPPEIVWRQPIGAGWSAFATANGYAVTMEQRGDQELTSCYRIADGMPVWCHARLSRFAVQGIGPRSTPAISGGRVYSIGAKGQLACLDGATGRCLWEHDLLAEYGSSADEDNDAIRYGRAGSPLIVDDLVIVPAGGPPSGPWVSLAAFNRTTGNKVWQAGTCQISCSSPRLLTIAGVRQIVIVSQDAVTGHEPETGRQLWFIEWPGKTLADANVTVPVPFGNDGLIISKGYGVGARLYRFTATADGNLEPQLAWRSAKVMRTHFSNPIAFDGHVYGLSDGMLECIDGASGGRCWKGKDYGNGQMMRIGTLALVHAERGQLYLLPLTPDQPPSIQGPFKTLDNPCWNNLAIAGNLLLLRNPAEAMCLRLPVTDPVK